MTVNTASLTSTLMFIVPWPLLVVGLLFGIGSDRYPKLMRRMTEGATWFALICAITAAMAYGLGVTRSATYVSVKLPENMGAFEINTSVNALTIVMLLLVSFVGRMGPDRAGRKEDQRKEESSRSPRQVKEPFFHQNSFERLSSLNRIRIPHRSSLPRRMAESPVRRILSRELRPRSSQRRTESSGDRDSCISCIPFLPDRS